MFEIFACLLLLRSAVLVEGTPSAPRPPTGRPGGAKTLWSHRAQDDVTRHSAEGVSHGTANRVADSHSEYPSYSATTVAEYWRPGSTNLTMSNGNTNSYAFSRPYSSLTNNYATYLKDLRGPAYYQSRPPKKNYPHYVFNKVQPHNSDLYKTKYKKTALYPSASVPVAYKKPLHPRVHKPYAKHKYPMQKTVHTPYRRYYQSPYQRYAIPAVDALRQKVAQSDYSHYASSPATASGHHTTERMDDAYPDGSAPSEDFARYNDTLQNTAGSYYDADEEQERSAAEDTASYDETTTRGYYGDRIYMSTHVPLSAPEKGPAFSTKNSYFILKRTSDEDDIETIFE